MKEPRILHSPNETKYKKKLEKWKKGKDYNPNTQPIQLLVT